jgi:hypothetical protein
MTYLRRYRPYLIGLVIATAVVILPLGIANAVAYSVVTILLLNLTLVLFLLGMIVFSTYYGRKLLITLKQLFNPNQVFMKRVRTMETRLYRRLSSDISDRRPRVDLRMIFTPQVNPKSTTGKSPIQSVTSTHRPRLPSICCQWTSL